MNHPAVHGINDNRAWKRQCSEIRKKKAIWLLVGLFIVFLLVAVMPAWCATTRSGSISITTSPPGYANGTLNIQGTYVMSSDDVVGYSGLYMNPGCGIDGNAVVSYDIDGGSKVETSNHVTTLGHIYNFSIGVNISSYSPNEPHIIKVYLTDLYTYNYYSGGCTFGDEVASRTFIFYNAGSCIDNDNDGHYVYNSTNCPFGDDCHDSANLIYPGAPENCDGWDNNCNGQIDEGFDKVWYRDADGDGYTNGSTLFQCAQPAGYKRATQLISTTQLDCNDTQSTIKPGATEICDGVDNNCDGQIDEGLSTDADGDGHYTAGSCLTPHDDVSDDSNEIAGPGDDAPNRKVCASSSNDVATGELSHDQELFSVKGSALPMNVNLSYRSQNYVQGPLRTGWRHNYGIYLVEIGNGNSVIFRSGSEKRMYTLSGGVYLPPARDSSTLIKNADGTYKITERSGTVYNFNTSGKITSILDKYGNSLTFTYNGDDLSTVADSSGKAVTYNYDTTVTPHRLTSISDPVGNLYNFEYDTSGLLWKVVHPADVNGVRGYWEYIYYTEGNNNGYLKTKKDPNGNTSQYFYDDKHRLIKTIDPEGGADPAGHTREYDFTGAAGSTTFKEKDTGNWTYIYDTTTGYVTSKTDPNGKTTSYTYYSDGNRKSVTSPGDGTVRNTTFYAYDSYGNTITVSDPIDLSALNPPVDPETVTDPWTIPGIKVVRYTYDHANNDRVLSVSDERGTTVLTTTYQYTTEDGYETITITDPEGKTTKVRKNADGTIKDAIDGNGKVTYFEYYPVTPENQTSGKAGQIYYILYTNGMKTTFTEYDKNGNVKGMKVTDSTGQDITSTILTYDAMSRLTSESTQALNDPTLPVITTTYGYDPNGNLTSVKDAENNETRYEYNYRGQAKKVTDANQKDTILTYGTGCSSCGGGVDKLNALTDANQHTTSYDYDKLGRLVKETYQDGMTKYIVYWRGEDTVLRYDGKYSLYTYDALHRLTSKMDLDTYFSESYTYDANGRLETAQNDNVLYNFTYYDNGWLKEVTDTFTGHSVSYEYNGIGQKTKIIINQGTPNERTITNDYDSANRPWHIMSNAGTFTYNYDASGRRQTLGYPNGITSTWDYDGLGRLISLTHMDGNNSVATFGYTEYDKVGNRKTIIANGSPTTYTYDNLYRLKTATKTKESESYTYDDVGNRLTGPGAKDTDYAYNAANQMTTGRGLNYDYNYYYDSKGNQATRSIPNAADKTWKQYWDYENRLVKLEKIKGTERKTVTFKYDPFGRRIEKKLVTVKGGDTKTQIYAYIYDAEDIVQETLTTDTTTEITRYTHGPGIDEPLAMERNGQFYYFHADGLGSITAITNASKAVVQSYTYDSFGMPKPTTNFRNAYTYTGREWDNETGLYFYRARYYDPMAGRFISKDPIGFRGGINLYAYVGNNPVNGIDPWGLEQSPYGEITAPSSLTHRVLDYFVTDFNNFTNPSQPNSRLDTFMKYLPYIVSGAEAGLAKLGAKTGRCAVETLPRTLPNNLAEQLTLQEAEAGAGERIMQGLIKDPLYPEDIWAKMQHVHLDLNTMENIVIHYWDNLVTGLRTGFKFK